MMTWQTIIAIAVVAALGWNLFRRFGSDRLAAFTEKRRATSRMVGRGEFLDGNRHLDVALALSGTSFFYENSDMQGSVDLQWVREIEYATDLATGVTVRHGRVLRLRSQSQTFEFILPTDDVARWHMMLPPRNGGTTAIMPEPIAVPT
jgi:hypothetical protein